MKPYRIVASARCARLACVMCVAVALFVFAPRVQALIQAEAYSGYPLGSARLNKLIEPIRFNGLVKE